MTELSLVVPTCDEAPNVPALVRRMNDALRDVCDYELLIVDDNSPDGTAAVARRNNWTYPVRVIVRTTNRGLAPSVLEGSRQTRGEADVVYACAVLEGRRMDADASPLLESVPPSHS